MVDGFIDDEVVRELCSELETSMHAYLDENAVTKCRDDSVGDSAHDGGSDCSHTTLEEPQIQRMQA